MVRMKATILRSVWWAVVLLGVAWGLPAGIAAAADGDKPVARVLIVVGPSTHPPGSHEVAAGGRLMQHCLENMSNIKGVKAEVVTEWPRDKVVRDGASTVVFIGDIFPAVQANSMRRVCSPWPHGSPSARVNISSSPDLPAVTVSKNSQPSEVSGKRRGLPDLPAATISVDSA